MCIVNLNEFLALKIIKNTALNKDLHSNKGQDHFNLICKSKDNGK